ncbi:MAG: 30S ribosomal protein S9 [archaeon]
MSKKSVVTIGKKKSATARATIQKGKGKVMINCVPVSEWGPYYERNLLLEPLSIVGNALDSMDIEITVLGGGPVGQAAACRVAMARGVVKFTGDDKLKKALITYDDKILSGDSRQREPCKPNDSAPRARRQKSYR